jgi:hypothetical protein
LFIVHFRSSRWYSQLRQSEIAACENIKKMD